MANNNLTLKNGLVTISSSLNKKKGNSPQVMSKEHIKV